MFNFVKIKNEMSVETAKRTKEVLEKCEKTITPAKKEFLNNYRNYLKTLSDIVPDVEVFSKVIEGIDALTAFLDNEAPILLACARNVVPRKPRDTEAEKARRKEKKAKLEAENAQNGEEVVAA